MKVNIINEPYLVYHIDTMSTDRTQASEFFILGFAGYNCIVMVKTRII
jgi:hypothetical protein